MILSLTFLKNLLLLGWFSILHRSVLLVLQPSHPPLIPADGALSGPDVFWSTLGWRNIWLL